MDHDGDAMRNARGFTLLELLVAIGVSGVVLFGLFSLYLMTTTSFAESDAQVWLQRQGTMALDEMARQIRRATATGTGCLGAGSLQVQNAGGTYCYYADDETGSFCQNLDGAGCRNLLAGGPTTIGLARQTSPADPRCPAGVATDRLCLVMTQNGSGVDLAFAITDGTRVMTFSSHLLGRNN
jgi:type IV pilus assembly protein PilW